MKNIYPWDASIAVVPRGFVEQVLQGLEDLLEEVTLDETSLKHFGGFLVKTGKSENTTSIIFVGTLSKR